tara:strand:+ start:47013 stop:47867 length:855 start_codon:yes stop_codon:yes gene_type:complete
MEILKNSVINGQHQKPIVLDVFYSKNSQPKPLVIFSHGYKGYKDWGCWNLVAEQFAQNNLFFVKFNFSHNGGTVEQPIDFPDLEAFAENNYTKELDDLQSVIDWIVAESSFEQEVDTSNITLIGHSRGGGIATLKTSEDKRVHQLITWAAVSDFAHRTSTIGDLEQWKKDGVKYVLNGRTKQQMPHNYQFYEDFVKNKAKLSIEKAVKKITASHLIIHGTDDHSISFEEAEKLHHWNSKSELVAIKGANHVFGSQQPWEANDLPDNLQEVITRSISFILRNDKK